MKLKFAGADQCSPYYPSLYLRANNENYTTLVVFSQVRGCFAFECTICIT